MPSDHVGPVTFGLIPGQRLSGLRLFSIAARLARTGRRIIVHLARDSTWTDLLLAGLTRLRTPLVDLTKRAVHHLAIFVTVGIGMILV